MTTHLSADPIDLTCPRCGHQVDSDRDGATWSNWRMWHTWCYDAWQADTVTEKEN